MSTQKPTLKYPAIDLHLHYVPVAYQQGLINAGVDKVDRWPMPSWDLQSNIDFMDAMGIGTGMLSISSPHIHFGDKKATRKLARNLNESAAEIVQKYPNRFGLMAVLPLPDVEGTLIEMEYALDVLKADGVKFTSNASGQYLGDSEMEPIFQEMSRRGTVGIIHPTCPSSVPLNSCDEVPIPAMEFMFDTMRAVANLMFKGVLRRNPGMRIVVPHAGCVLSMLVDRFDGMAVRSGLIDNPPDVYEEMKKLYFDIAGYVLPTILPALRNFVDIDHILYGSDWPYMKHAVGAELGAKFMAESGLTEDEMKKVMYGNALELFPRLKQYY